MSHKLESDNKKTVKNAEERIHEDSGSLRVLQKIQNKNQKVKIDEIHDLGGLYNVMVDRMLDNEVVISGFGLQVLSDIK